MQRRRRNSEFTAQMVLAAVVRDLQAEGKTGLVQWLYKDRTGKQASNMEWAATQALMAIEAATGETATHIGPIGLGRILEMRRMPMEEIISLIKTAQEGSSRGPFGPYGGAFVEVRGLSGKQHLIRGAVGDNLFVRLSDEIKPDREVLSTFPAGVIEQRKSGKYGVYINSIHSDPTTREAVPTKVPRISFDSVADAIRYIHENAGRIEMEEQKTPFEGAPTETSSAERYVVPQEFKERWAKAEKSVDRFESRWKRLAKEQPALTGDYRTDYRAFHAWKKENIEKVVDEARALRLSISNAVRMYNSGLLGSGDSNFWKQMERLFKGKRLKAEKRAITNGIKTDWNRDALNFLEKMEKERDTTFERRIEAIESQVFDVESIHEDLR